MKQITAYRCGHCPRVMVTKKSMESHERQCIRNPETKTCASCWRDKVGGRCEFIRHGEKIEFDCPRWESVDSAPDEVDA